MAPYIMFHFLTDLRVSMLVGIIQFKMLEVVIFFPNVHLSTLKSSLYNQQSHSFKPCQDLFGLGNIRHADVLIADSVKNKDKDRLIHSFPTAYQPFSSYLKPESI